MLLRSRSVAHRYIISQPPASRLLAVPVFLLGALNGALGVWQASPVALALGVIALIAALGLQAHHGEPFPRARSAAC